MTDLADAGSTFDAPFFNLAFPACQHPSVGVSYAAVGSHAGITRFTARQVNFGATDVPASAGDLAGARGGPALQVPVDLGAVAVAYNVPGLNGTRLRLTGPVLAKIFLGPITKWDDPALVALNPGAGLPDAYITVMHRSDGSGTTYIFSNYLSEVSPAWAKAAGTGRSLRCPAGTGADGNSGVADATDTIPYSIGYAETSYTSGNAHGKRRHRQPRRRLRHPPAAHPISGYSWVLISARQTSQPAGQALVALLSWLTHPAQSYPAQLGYVLLPPAVQRLAAATLAQVTGPSGSLLAA